VGVGPGVVSASPYLPSPCLCCGVNLLIVPMMNPQTQATLPRPPAEQPSTKPSKGNSNTSIEYKNNLSITTFQASALIGLPKLDPEWITGSMLRVATTFPFVKEVQGGL
jgi:hypothetical protein